MCVWFLAGTAAAAPKELLLVTLPANGTLFVPRAPLQILASVPTNAMVVESVCRAAETVLKADRASGLRALANDKVVHLMSRSYESARRTAEVEEATQAGLLVSSVVSFIVGFGWGGGAYHLVYRLLGQGRFPFRPIRRLSVCSEPGCFAPFPCCTHRGFCLLPFPPPGCAPDVARGAFSNRQQGLRMTP